MCIAGELTYPHADEQDRGLVGEHNAPTDEDPDEQDASRFVKANSALMDIDPSHGGGSGDAPQDDVRHESAPVDEDPGEHGSGNENEESKSAPQRTWDLNDA